MVAADGALDSVTFPPPNWPKNKRGLPTIDAFLEHKALEARWREGDAVIPDLRMFMVPADLDRGQACSKYAKEACVRAWTKGRVLEKMHLATSGGRIRIATSSSKKCTAFFQAAAMDRIKICEAKSCWPMLSSNRLTHPSPRFRIQRGEEKEGTETEMEKEGLD